MHLVQFLHVAFRILSVVLAPVPHFVRHFDLLTGFCVNLQGWYQRTGPPISLRSHIPERLLRVLPAYQKLSFICTTRPLD